MVSVPTRIGIAIVEHDGCFLVGTRGENSSLPGYSEFPGGKCHAGETPDECARRECYEESGLSVQVVRLMLRCRHRYAHGDVDLFFYVCQPMDRPRAKTVHCGFRWVSREQLALLKFPEANQPVLEQLVSQNWRLSLDNSVQRPE